MSVPCDDNAGHAPALFLSALANRTKHSLAPSTQCGPLLALALAEEDGITQGEQSAPSALEWTLGLGQQSRQDHRGVEVWRVWVEEGSVPPSAEGSFVIQPGRSLGGQKCIHI